jgi:hypothetical protein
MASPRFRSLALLLAPIAASFPMAASTHAAPPAPLSPAVLKVNGGWCWFQDERAIVIGDTLVFGSVAGADRGGHQAGDIDVTAVDLRSGQTSTTTLHAKLQSDDHNTPAFLALPDGRVLATYQTHGKSPGVTTGLGLMRWRRTESPNNFTAWTPEQSLPVGAVVSYSNLFQVGADGGPIYNFHRGNGWNPNYLISTDGGMSFTYGGRLLNWPPAEGPGATRKPGGGRPYLKYTQASDHSIHLVVTEDHPHSFDNSLYHAFIRDGKIHHSDGRVIGPVSTTSETALTPQDLTLVFRGSADQVAWMCDVEIDGKGHPRVVFSVQRGGAKPRGTADNGQDLRYHHARWDGTQWRVTEIAHAGTRLYAGEDDYAGLAAIDPQHPNTVYISTNADPRSGAPLISAADGQRHWEIYRGDSTDDGTTFTWTPVTRDSTADNLRPIVPIWRAANDRTILLWLRGTYRKYTDYDLDVVGLLPSPRGAPAKP